MAVKDLFGLLEQRANFYTASNAGSGMAAQLAQFFCDGFKCSDSTKLLGYQTASFRNALAAEGPFPLIIYMTAFNGMSYENFSLFEALAQQGYIVASISSIGRFPGDMTMNKADLMEQVNDALTALYTFKRQRSVDFTQIGIVGYSWGGLAGAVLAGAVLAGKIPNVKSVVSLDGSEFHHYGNAKEENDEFDSIKLSGDFKNIHLTAPYLRLESSPLTQATKDDSVYNFSADHFNNAQIFTIDSAQHEDFDCFSLVVKKSGNCRIDDRYTTALKMTVSFLNEHLKKDLQFTQTVEEALTGALRKK